MQSYQHILLMVTFPYFILHLFHIFSMDMLFPPPKPGTPPPKNMFTEVFLQMCPGKNPADGMHLQIAEFISDPRTIKTHLPFSLLPPSLLDTTKVRC